MNEKLALNDDILMKIEKPARYIGNEVNAVVKDRDSIDVRFCMCFPDVYEIGMSHLGIQILYGMLNSGMMSGVSVCILPGWIWMKLCVRRTFRCLPWRVRIR